MNEKEIAEQKVIPYLEKLGWPKSLISQYGRVPVQMGTDVNWADIVLLIVDQNVSAIPYLVVEVKQRLDNLSEVLAQTDSYSKFLDTTYFLITDGTDYIFYQRKPTGGYMKISSVPIPDKEHLTITQNTKFKPGIILCSTIALNEEKITIQYSKELHERIDEYFNLVSKGMHYFGEGGYSLRLDMIWHYLAIKRLNNLIHKKIDSLEPEDFKKYIERSDLHSIMCNKPPNINNIFFEVDKNFDKIKEFLRFIKEFEGDPEENLEKLLGRNSDLHIKGMGVFVVSQFLAGSHPRSYTIVEDRMINTMKELGLIDTKVKSNTAKGYLYINEICKRLYNELFRHKVEENKDELGFIIDDDFGLVLIHEFFWEYSGFYSFDKTQLEEATKDEIEELELDKTENEYIKELNNIFS